MRFAALIIAAIGLHAARAEDSAEITPEEATRRAQEAAAADFRSAQTIGRFTTWILGADGKNRQIKSDGQFIGLYDDEAMRIDFQLTKNKRVLLVGGETGETVELVDSRTQDAACVSSEGRVRLHSHIAGHPSSYSKESWLDVFAAVGFPFEDPFHLESKLFFDVKGLLEHQKLKPFSDGKLFAGQIQTKNGPRIREFTIDPAAGFHVTKSTMYLGDKLGSTHELHWSQQGDQWFVSRIKSWQIVNLNTNLARECECKILSFRPHVEIDPELFEPKSLDTPLEPVALPTSAPKQPGDGPP